MSTAQQVYQMLGNHNLWQVATECHRALAESQIPYSVCGAVAVCLHGYQRNTVDLDLIIHGSFARFLHASVRQTFRELVKNARGQS